jgi:hypothetical protein
MLLRSTSKYYEVLFYQKHFIRNKLDRPQLFAQKEERSTPTQYVARMLNLRNFDLGFLYSIAPVLFVHYLLLVLYVL